MLIVRIALPLIPLLWLIGLALALLADTVFKAAKFLDLTDDELTILESFLLSRGQRKFLRKPMNNPG